MFLKNQAELGVAAGCHTLSKESKCSSSPRIVMRKGKAFRQKKEHVQKTKRGDEDGSKNGG